MTEKLTETVTEQRWLGNKPEAYLHDGHRIAPPKLTPLTQLRAAPVPAMARPYDVVQANILLRRSVTAAAGLKLARQAAKQAEDAMSEALAAENLAEIDSVEADRALLDFAREAADQ